ncbi:MAG: hypothetical protein DSZ31_01340 [Gammaproteobacteria bacterium]|nr:MAG: hypothetical protein DSZ31_01340 [Gammaproteobacteria bacterium]
MRKKLLSLALFAGAFAVGFPSFSQESGGKAKEQQVKEENQISIEIEAVDQDDTQVKATIEKKIEDYFRRLGIHRGNNGGRYFEYAVVSDLHLTDPNFYREKITAYEKAYMDALERIAKFLGTKIESEVTRELYADLTGGQGFNPEPKESPIKVFFRKIVALGDAALNKLLEKLGVDPSQFGKLTFEERKKLAEDLIRRQIAVKTLAELSGVTIVKTVEGSDKNGNYAVGVIVMYSPRLKQFAYDIAHGKAPALRKKGKPLEDYLPKTPAGWLSAWGSRVVIDEDGYPAIIGYGQWAIPLDTNNKTFLNIAKQSAREKAEMNARAYIADFVNSQFTLEEFSVSGNEKATELVKEIPGNTYEVNKNVIQDILNKKAKKVTKANLVGVEILAEKSFRINIGGKKYLVYVVAAGWSYKNYLTAKGMKNWKPSYKEEKKVEETKPSKESYKEQVFEGPETTDIYDW